MEANLEYGVTLALDCGQGEYKMDELVSLSPPSKQDMMKAKRVGQIEIIFQAIPHQHVSVACSIFESLSISILILAVFSNFSQG